MSVNKNLSRHTSLFGLRLWVILVAFTILFTVLFLITIFLCIIYLCRQKSRSSKPHFSLPNAISRKNYWTCNNTSSLDRRLLSSRISEIEMNIAKLDHHSSVVVSPQASGMITIQRSGNLVSDLESVARYSFMASDAWRGNRFSLRDIDVVTNGFSDENLIGNGEFSGVYRGILLDTTRVAVKRLFSKSVQVDDFMNKVELIGHVRHKNLIKLLGYCTEGGYRMLVNEYVDNGNLHQWLHGCQEQVSPLTWSIRMNIIQGVAKGLAYLHEDIEPKIVHLNLKSTNVLLDHQWNPKISDFGIVKLFGTEGNDLTTSLSGYSSQEYASNGVLNEKTDVYSFGILVMEIICGRKPVDHNQSQIYLIDWLKSMVANQKIMYVADPKLTDIPNSKDLKRILCLALRCVDPDLQHRPTMGDVIHMLEPRDLLLSDIHERRLRRDSSSHRICSQESQIVAKSIEDEFNTREGESSCNVYQKMMSK
ncbi:probable serine/threonine-protein kinase At1g01540 isoform X1 [Jatropha curcas]|uniref:probable serine/threonine-protein kinase At1g01540 isoform X1 n=1 Tax=Jatropha curcas TaxID=180498 RepID=UPI0009D786C2|nr:probable serine/threonine-protein kinase At1g01540 isoform X1 [Jatropha curcas]